MGEIKDGWKSAGKDLGHAFKNFGKTVLKSARTVVDKADDKCNKSEEKKDSDVVDVVDVKATETTNEASQEATEVVDSPKEKESTVFNDGSWREVGKGFGKGFGGMGKMIGKTLSKPFKKETKTNKSKKSKPVETDVKEIE